MLLLTRREALVIQVTAYLRSFLSDLSDLFVDRIIGDVAMFVKLLFHAHVFNVPQLFLYAGLEGQELTMWWWLLRRKR